MQKKILSSHKLFHHVCEKVHRLRWSILTATELCRPKIAAEMWTQMFKAKFKASGEKQKLCNAVQFSHDAAFLRYATIRSLRSFFWLFFMPYHSQQSNLVELRDHQTLPRLIWVFPLFLSSASIFVFTPRRWRRGSKKARKFFRNMIHKMIQY